MSMYGMVMGDGRQASRGAILLSMLTNQDPGRFRDAWIEKGEDGEPLIVIYTRNGGGNRECYCEDSSCTGCKGEAFEAQPECVRAADDDFDCTYRTYWFRTPAEHRDTLLPLSEDEPVDMGARWLAVIKAIGEKTDG